MNNILIVLEAMLKMGIFFIGWIVAIFIGFMVIQLISYRLFNYNIYKRIMVKLFN